MVQPRSGQCMSASFKKDSNGISAKAGGIAKVAKGRHAGMMIVRIQPPGRLHQRDQQEQGGRAPDQPGQHRARGQQ